MTVLIILNVVLAAIVFGVIVAMKVLAIRAERSAHLELVSARAPRVHRRARTAHGQPARAAQRQAGPVGA